MPLSFQTPLINVNLKGIVGSKRIVLKVEKGLQLQILSFRAAGTFLPSDIDRLAEI